jgi:hypothetical protein
VLAAFAPGLQRYAQRRLEKMGVEVWLNTMAQDMDSGSVTVIGVSFWTSKSLFGNPMRGLAAGAGRAVWP